MPEFSEKDVLIAKFAKALSHPARVYIMRELSCLNGCCTSSEFFENLPIARSTLSQHLKELKYAGLIQGYIHPPFIKYCINKDNWELAKKSFGEFLEK
ncbi:MAG TPA: helix-turn-helix transcriptional regulator [Bacteroidales bacterium]|nr:helix-turn-helix transcriptional regulator [Bacteroidales bacterium]